jgi:hypothetical protein
MAIGLMMSCQNKLPYMLQNTNMKQLINKYHHQTQLYLLCSVLMCSCLMVVSIN